MAAVERSVRSSLAAPAFGSNPYLTIDAAAPLARRRWSEWRDAGVAAVLATVVVDEDTEGAIANLADWLRVIREHAGRLTLATQASDGGLSRLGADVIAEMNRVGMVVDLSHAGLRTSLDA